MFRYGILLFFITLCSNGVKSQDVKIYSKFAALEKDLFLQNDTCYVINFWATWCAPCIKELPYFEAYQKENSTKKIKVILVSLDFKSQLNTKLIPFLKAQKLQSTVVLLDDTNYDSWLAKVAAEWTGAIPATLLIKGNKRVFAEQSFENTVELTTFINTFLNQ